MPRSHRSDEKEEEEEEEEEGAPAAAGAAGETVVAYALRIQQRRQCGWPTQRKVHCTRGRAVPILRAGAAGGAGGVLFCLDALGRFEREEERSGVEGWTLDGWEGEREGEAGRSIVD